MIVDRHPRCGGIGASIVHDRHPAAGVSVGNSLYYTLLRPITDTSAKKGKHCFLLIFVFVIVFVEKLLFFTTDTYTKKGETLFYYIFKGIEFDPITPRIRGD